MESNDIKVDEIKVRRMLMKILMEERKNSKTKKYSDSEMVTRMQKIIEEEVECL